MPATRLEQLIKYYEEDPTDPFTLYGLALEYLKIDVKKSEVYFDTLLKEFSDYLPTYYHAAKLKADLGAPKTALEIYRKGIELAEKSNERTTLRELQSAYNELLFEEDL
jgi:tetratricopeptide (TPR) repeat protein